MKFFILSLAFLISCPLLKCMEHKEQNVPSSDQIPGYQQKYNELIAHQKQLQASEWSDVEKIRENVMKTFSFMEKDPERHVRAYLKNILRCGIDESYLTKEQEKRFNNYRIMGPLIEPEIFEKMHAGLAQSLKKAIENDWCGGLEWREKYGKIPEDMPMPSPKTLKKERLKVIEKVIKEAR